MPTFTIHCQTPLTRSFRVEQVAGLFDLPLEDIESRLTHELMAELPGLEEDWTIGAIVGPSGSGKTTLARAVYGDALYDPQPWPGDAAIIDCLGDAQPADGMTVPIKHIAHTLTAVGLGSVPTWLKPYRVLSTGERFRADLARAILGARGWGLGTGEDESRASPSPEPRVPSPSLLVIDEFTSTLDRTIAQTASAALARLLRHPQSEIPNPKFIALTCHTDILPWLAPDWVLDLGRMKDEGGSKRMKDEGGRMNQAGKSVHPSSFCLHPLWRSLQRPQLRLAVRRVPQCVWPHFARHHYLAGGLAASATCYAAFCEPGLGLGARAGDERASLAQAPSPSPSPSMPVAFCAVVASLGWKKTKRITRLVTLPEFQGLGIAAQLAETVAAHEQSKGHRITITASHPAILAHCTRSPNWTCLGIKKSGSTRQRLAARTIRCSTGRAVASFEFVGKRSQ
jgi:hypothetical protein